MSNAQKFYEQLDGFETRADTLRTEFKADVDRFGSWDAEENDIDERFDGIEYCHKQIYGRIEELENIELNLANSEQGQKDDDLEQAKKLIREIDVDFSDTEDDLNSLEKGIGAWRDDNDRGDPEE